MIINSVWSKDVVLEPGRWYFVEFEDKTILVGQMSGWVDGKPQFLFLDGIEQHGPARAWIVGETMDPTREPDGWPS